MQRNQSISVERRRVEKEHEPVSPEIMETLKLFYLDKKPVGNRQIYRNRSRTPSWYYVLGDNHEEIPVYTIGALNGKRCRERKIKVTSPSGGRYELEQEQKRQLLTESMGNLYAKVQEVPAPQILTPPPPDADFVLEEVVPTQITQPSGNNVYRNSLFALTRMFDGTPTVLSSQEQEETMDIFDLNDPMSDLNFELLTKGLK